MPRTYKYKDLERDGGRNPHVDPDALVFINKNGYICYENSGRRIHDCVMYDKKGPKPKGYHIHHIDENKLNNHPDNLEYVVDQ